MVKFRVRQKKGKANKETNIGNKHAKPINIQRKKKNKKATNHKKKIIIDKLISWSIDWSVKVRKWKYVTQPLLNGLC